MVLGVVDLLESHHLSIVTRWGLDFGVPSFTRKGWLAFVDLNSVTNTIIFSLPVFTTMAKDQLSGFERNAAVFFHMMSSVLVKEKHAWQAQP
jgi:hypothetical protein